MAEAVFRKLASQHLGCSVDNLREHNLDVLSAGVAAADSEPASLSAIGVLEERGIDLSDHLSQQLTEEMLVKSDFVFTMTSTQLQAVQNSCPDIASKMRLLSSSGMSISDPIGYGTDYYRTCADEITECLKQIVSDLLSKDTKKT